MHNMGRMLIFAK